MAIWTCTGPSYALSRMQEASRNGELQYWRVPYANGVLRHAQYVHDHVSIQEVVASSPPDDRRA